jgi:hypothetical protein
LTPPVFHFLAGAYAAVGRSRHIDIDGHLAISGTVDHTVLIVWLLAISIRLRALARE